MTPVLLVTPFFAPQSHAAVFRAHKLAKLLPRYGYRPIVVTVDQAHDYPEDVGLLAELPKEVVTIRARHIEPSLRGLRHWCSAPASEQRRGVPPALRAPRRESELRDFVNRGLLRTPDRHWSWFLPALLACRDAKRKYDIKLVITSADPFTSHALGLRLKAEGMRWVADLRDPPTHCRYMHSEYPWVYALQRSIERRAVQAADIVTAAAQSIGLILTESYDVDLSTKFRFIPTGLDEELLGSHVEPPTITPGRTILFSGEYLPYYGERFFCALAAALKRPEVAELNYRLQIVGRLDVNRPRIDPYILKYGLGEHVTFLGHQSQDVLYGLIKASEFVVLPYGDLARWWCLPAKLVDYIALRKPVLALVPNPSEARSRLAEAGLGIFLDGAGSDVAEQLARALAAGGHVIEPVLGVCSEYTAERQVSRFAGVFEELMAGA